MPESKQVSHPVASRPTTRHVVGIGMPVEYLGKRWTVQTITKQHVVLQGTDNPSRTTRVELYVFERLV